MQFSQHVLNDFVWAQHIKQCIIDLTFASTILAVACMLECIFCMK